MKGIFESINAVLNYNDCEVFDLLVKLHKVDVQRKIGFYGRVRMGWLIMTGQWTPMMTTMPSGATLREAFGEVALKIDRGIRE